MQQPPELVLRDIHQPAAPPWWPLAPGWWIVIGATIVVLAVGAWWRFHRQRRRLAVERAFDTAIASAGSAAGRVAMASELLRRAARRSDPRADRLQGGDWLRFLDGVARRTRRTPSTAAAALSPTPFSDGPGQLLLDGGFRRDLGDAEVAALLPLARRRYLQLMGQGR